MTTYHHLTLLVLLISLSVLRQSTSDLLSTYEDGGSPHRGTIPGPTQSGQRSSIQMRHEEDKEELFKDVDPRTLAAVLLEAMNRSQVQRSREEDRNDGMEVEIRAERREVKKDEEFQERHRDGRQELELLMASQAEQREEEEEQREALEEERMTERVTSRTSSQTVQVQTEQNPNSSATPQPEEEEQLSPEELKSLETMMKEFPRLDLKREDGSEQKTRDDRASSSFNDIDPAFKGSDLAWSKKKLKWQEETQKALHLPTFREGNAVEDSQKDKYADQEVTAGDDLEEQQELSPEEEEAQAQEEQEEMMRQAAEARRAKLEEEKLADIASDMLLRYMVKQNHGDRKSSSSSSAAEDKRSDEELVEENDIDPQTIDKLIEISSKLHLPADDVVDIITDVEKKKRKDVLPDVASQWQRPPLPLSSSFLPANQNSFPVARQPSPATNLLKTWFQEKNRLSKPLLVSHGFWPKQEHRLKPSKPVWTGNSFYQYPYPPRTPQDYYPIYLLPVHRPKSHYYLPRPAPPVSNFMDDPFTFPPRRRYHSWVPPRFRKPPAGLKSFYSSYPVPKPPFPARQRPLYNPVGRPSGTRSKDEDLEKIIQLILREKPQKME